MTPLKKVVTRRSDELYRDRSKFRRIIVSVHPGGFIGLRLEKCRKLETISLRAAYEAAITARVRYERAQKTKDKKMLVRRGRV